MIYETSAVEGGRSPDDQVSLGYPVVNSPRKDDEVLATASVGYRSFDDGLDGAGVSGMRYRVGTCRVRQDRHIVEAHEPIGRSSI
jgi:hypothetical protein